MNLGYETLHLHMGYDGTKNKKTCDSGFDLANTIINRCALLKPQMSVPNLLMFAPTNIINTEPN